MLTGAIKSDVKTIWRVAIELIDCILLLRLGVIKYTNFTEPSWLCFTEFSKKLAQRNLEQKLISIRCGLNGFGKRHLRSNQMED